MRPIFNYAMHQAAECCVDRFPEGPMHGRAFTVMTHVDESLVHESRPLFERESVEGNGQRYARCIRQAVHGTMFYT